MATPEDIKLRISAQNDAKPVLNDLNRQLDQTSAKAKGTSTSAKVMGDQFAVLGSKTGRASVQIQQLVGQVQGGQNPMLALSQQAADLGIVLGAPLLGAVAGLAASLGMVLLPQLFKASETFSDVVDKVKKLKQETGELGKAQKALLILDLQQKIDAEKDAIKEADEGLKAFNRALTTYGELTEEDIKKQAQLKAANESSKKSIELMNNAIGILNGTIEEENENVQSMIESLKEEAETLGMTSTQLAIYQARKEGATNAQIEAIKAHRETIDQYNLELEVSKQLAEEQAKIDKKREEYAKKHNQAQQDMYKAQDDATKAMAQNLKPLEDGLVNLINGTKSASEAFRDMARSIINDLIRMQIQQSITGPLASALSGFSLFGGSGATSTGYSNIGAPAAIAASAKALGGPVTAGQAYTVGEHGRETFIPSTDGQIVPNGAGGGVTINQTINVSTGVSQTVRAEIMGLMPQIANASKAAVLDARKRGGSYAGAF